MPTPNELFDLSGRVAVITGGGGLIGGNHARALAGAGAHVVLLDVDESTAERNAERVRQEGGSAEIAIGSVLDEDFLRAVRGGLNRCDVLVNSHHYRRAGGYNPEYFASLDNAPFDDFMMSLQMHIGGSFLTARVFGGMMAEAGKGSIINTASTYGIVAPDQRIYEDLPFNTPAHYGAAKAGVIGLTRYLATYWADKGVRANVLTPGGVFDGHTDPFLSRYSYRVPLGRMADREDFMGAVLFLASDASRYVTGQNIIVDGGWSAW